MSTPFSASPSTLGATPSSHIFPFKCEPYEAETAIDTKPASTTTQTSEPLGIHLTVPLLSPEDICVSATAQDALNRQLLDCLLTEISLHTAKVKQRPLQLLHCHNIHNRFNAAELTELLYFISSHFAAPCGQQEFSTNIDYLELQEHKLALLKGLGFNRIQLTLNQTPEPCGEQPYRDNQLAGKACLLRDYGFRQLCIQLYYGHPQQTVEQLERLTTEVLAAQPQMIQLISQTSPLNPLGTQQFSQLFQQLKQSHYLTLGNDYFIHPDSCWARAQEQHTIDKTPIGYNLSRVRDILGIGPGAQTQLAGHYQRHETSTEKYLQALSQLHLPIVEQTQLNRREQQLLALINQLNCYHSIDFNRPPLDAPPAERRQLEQAINQLQNSCQARPFSRHSDTHTLTHWGQLHLTELILSLPAIGRASQ